MNINWYPGHMKKTMDNIRLSLKLVDIVGEIIDSRIPISSKNPVIDDVLKDKPRIMILNKSDMADENETKKWLSYYRKKGYGAVVVDALHSKGLDKIYSVAKEMLADKFKKLEEKNLSAKTIRMMIVGIPNVGKSTFINSISKRKSAKIGDRPGVTKQVQWIKTKNDLELLDTPGVLWPKFEDERIGLHLAFTGAIKDEIMDIENLAFRFIDELNNYDYFLLCSDGLTNMIEKEEIQNIVRNDELSIAVNKLIDKCVERGGIDNISVAIIKNLGGENHD